MKVFIRKSDNKLFDIQSFREAHSQWGIPDDVDAGFARDLGYAVVDYPDSPALKPWQTANLVAEKKGSAYSVKWKVEDEANLNEIKAAIIAEKRFKVETGGVEIFGAKIATDRHTQQVLTAMFVRASADDKYEVRFKTESAFATLTAPQIIAIANAVHDHVQAAFDRENELLVKLENGEEVGAEDW